ncbi:MAG TPA: C45 family autoproteolytic acyltransferase/hydrolase [Candidatus Sumerlaeota bacterium]|nr:C45 family autoproteolytic acyltransferase/hydrolase [Candidatus Sumerlaeota bacterium]HPS00870.1 C45 family autoproteolytic acyltransferase/hydrolase [Candidatus Sumerlaeota bacterium]
MLWMIENRNWKGAGLAILILVGLSLGVRGEGYRTKIEDSGRQYAVCVVKGTPYEMGRSLGELMKPEATEVTTRILGAVQADGNAEFSNEALDRVWKTCEPHISQDFQEEMRGLADGSGLPLDLLKRVHMIPLVDDYSCSSIAVWGKASEKGDLYVTRNLDWILDLKAHDFPCIVVYLPEKGIAHVNVSFAGYIGCNTGFNAKGIALSEMGDSPAKDKPYDLNGTHFTMLFRDILSRDTTLDQVLDRLNKTKRIKKYHYVFGSGQEKKAVKIKAHAPELLIWPDNDPTDERAPNVLENCVYEDGGRGAFPLLKQDYGKHNAQTIIAISKAIPIKGNNVLNVVYNATAFECWVSYAREKTEAYTLPYVHIDCKPYLDFSKPVGALVARTGQPAIVPQAPLKPGESKFTEFTKEAE